jgi:hypothetical protein
MTDKWEITSAVTDIFDPPDHPLTQFLKTVDSVMNGHISINRSYYSPNYCDSIFLFQRNLHKKI